MATTNSTIEKIAPMFTELLIKKIECLKTDWQKPWITSLEQGLPRNIRGTLYNGGNVLMLLFYTEFMKFTLPVFLTFNQAKEEDLSVSKGARSFPVYYWFKFVVHKETKKTIKYEEYRKLPAPLSPVEKLEKQDKRNKEIALERTVEDTKKQILEADITGGKFSADEDTMLYFFLLSSLRKEHFAAVGIAEDKPYITDEDKMGIIGNLTVKMKTIIRRDFLVANFKGAYGNNTVATLLLDFARRHMPEELANIEREYNGVYEKRHQRIEEKKAVLLVQERARERKVAQPEEQPQPEEIAA